MDGNPLLSEQLVSFAGAQGMGPYPTTVSNPSNMAGRWSWADSLPGRFIMMHYAFTSFAEEAQEFFFENKTFANIGVIAEEAWGEGSTFPMEKFGGSRT